MLTLPCSRRRASRLLLARIPCSALAVPSAQPRRRDAMGRPCGNFHLAIGQGRQRDCGCNMGLPCAPCLQPLGTQGGCPPTSLGGHRCSSVAPKRKDAADVPLNATQNCCGRWGALSSGADCLQPPPPCHPPQVPIDIL